MPLKIRLARGGAKKRPYYRIVIADSRSPRDGKFIDRIGSYNPLLPREHAERVRIDPVKADDWLRKGARPTDRVARFLSYVHVKEPTAEDLAAMAAAEAEARGETADAATAEGEAATADAQADGPQAKAPPRLIAVDKDTPGARQLFSWEHGNNPNRAEPGQKAKEREAERKEKQEARKAAEAETAAAANVSDGEEGGEDAAPAEES